MPKALTRRLMLAWQFLYNYADKVLLANVHMQTNPAVPSVYLYQ